MKIRSRIEMLCLLAVLALAGGCADAGSGGPNWDHVCGEIRCDDADPCTDDICDVSDPRVCIFPPAAEDTVCGEGGVCDGAGSCVECNRDEHCEDDFNECSRAFCYGHSCHSAAVADNTACAGGLCIEGDCALLGTHLPCTEQGIRNAIAAGGGSYTFDCDGPTTVTTSTEIIIDNDVILDGGGALSIDGGDEHRVFSVSERVSVELRGITVSGGRATRTIDIESCGGIANDGVLTLVDCNVSGNAAPSGGGGGICNSRVLKLVDSTVSGNAARSCAGIFNNLALTLVDSTVSDNNAEAGGGGVCNSGVLTATSSTVSKNSASHSGGIENSGVLRLYNSTISGNIADEGASELFNIGSAEVVSSTVSGDSGGLVELRNLGELTMARSVIAGTCDGDQMTASNGYNLESPGNACGFDQPSDRAAVTEEALALGPLGDHGGPTFTHPLREGSVAVDVIPEALCGLSLDQRGEPRPESSGSACDAGAFELQTQEGGS